MRDPNQTTPLPVPIKKGKVMGTQDFSGQDSGYPEASPEAEVRENNDSGTAGVNYQQVPTIDDPSQKKAASTVFQSDDDRIHASRCGK